MRSPKHAAGELGVTILQQLRILLLNLPAAIALSLLTLPFEILKAVANTTSNICEAVIRYILFVMGPLTQVSTGPPTRIVMPAVEDDARPTGKILVN